MQDKQHLTNEEAEALYNSLSQDKKDKVIELNRLLQDEDFVETLKASPNETLKAKGFDLSEGRKLVVLDANEQVSPTDDENTVYIRLPAVSAELGDEMLENVNAAMISPWWCLATVFGFAAYVARGSLMI